MQNIDTNLSPFSHNNSSNIFSFYFIGAEDIFQVTNLAKPSLSLPILTTEQTTCLLVLELIDVSWDP